MLLGAGPGQGPQNTEAEILQKRNAFHLAFALRQSLARAFYLRIIGHLAFSCSGTTQAKKVIDAMAT
jgi:hypothetical protein